MIDTDDLIVEVAGKSVAEIFVDDGEDHFRALEVAAVERALLSESGVISLGGGAVMNNSTAARLRSQDVPVVFLDVSISAAAPRIGFNRDRPLLIGNPRASWIALMDKRRPVYEQLATYTVVTDDRTPEQVAAEIGMMLHEHD